MTLTLTTAAREALVGATGLDALELLRLQLGSGAGPGGDTDAGRAVLRQPRDEVAVGEADGPAGAVAVTALIAPTANYDVTEVGLWGRIDGAELLVGYWSDDGDAIAAARTGGQVEVAVLLDLRGTAGPTIEFRQDVPGPPGPPGDCSRTEASLTACQADLVACNTARETAEASLATCNTARETAEASLATCNTARETAEAALAACRLALAACQDVDGGANKETRIAVLLTAARPRLQLRGYGVGPTNVRYRRISPSVGNEAVISSNKWGTMSRPTDTTIAGLETGLWLVRLDQAHQPYRIRATAAVGS